MKSFDDIKSLPLPISINPFLANVPISYPRFQGASNKHWPEMG